MSDFECSYKKMVITTSKIAEIRWWSFSFIIRWCWKKCLSFGCIYNAFFENNILLRIPSEYFCCTCCLVIYLRLKWSVVMKRFYFFLKVLSHHCSCFIKKHSWLILGSVIEYRLPLQSLKQLVCFFSYCIFLNMKTTRHVW